MFAGSHLLTIDDKGRLAIPARFRQQLADDYGQQVFITRAYQPCVEIYPASVFKTLAEQIQNLDDRTAADKLKEVFIGHAVETEMDKQGRVLLPQILRRFARLDASAVLVGQINRFDIWAESVWTEKFGEDRADDLASAFALLKR
jgi:MraZ protein